MKKLWLAADRRKMMINPRFRSGDMDPCEDSKFMDAMKGITEGKTPWVHRTFLGQIVVRAPENGEPELKLLGIIVRRLDFDEEETREGRRTIDTLFARYSVREATEEELRELRPGLMAMGYRLRETKTADARSC